MVYLEKNVFERVVDKMKVIGLMKELNIVIQTDVEYKNWARINSSTTVACDCHFAPSFSSKRVCADKGSAMASKTFVNEASYSILGDGSYEGRLTLFL